MMKLIKVIFMSFLCWSCQIKSDKKDTKSTDYHVPKIFIASDSHSIRTSSDTLYIENKLFSGFVFQLNSATSDTIALIGYKDGLLEGITKKWYAKDKPMEERFYSKGAKNGEQKAYWENGKKRFEFNAQNDVYEGTLREWNNKGDLIHLATFKDGQEEGTQKMWYDNGKIRANYVIKNGKRYGLLGTKNCVNVSDSVFVVK